MNNRFNTFKALVTCVLSQAYILSLNDKQFALLRVTPKVIPSASCRGWLLPDQSQVICQSVSGFLDSPAPVQGPHVNREAKWGLWLPAPDSVLIHPPPPPRPEPWEGGLLFNKQTLQSEIKHAGSMHFITVMRSFRALQSAVSYGWFM